MNTQRVKLAWFSPTGTTGRVVEGIARGLGADEIERFDATLPEARERSLSVAADETLVIGVPVYMGRVPALLAPWLERLEGHGGPAVCVVVYGNRAFEDALLELSDTVADHGFVPVAGGAFIGEHSFSNDEEPTAVGRPDADDLDLAETFGRQIRQKLENGSALAPAPIPGERPYGGRTELWNVDFIAVSDACGQCGHCAEVCPVGAIDADDPARIDQELCITCCACLKACPQQARSMKPSPVKEAAKRLNTLFSEPKQPEWFL